MAVGGSLSADRYNIGYSTDGQVWSLAKETNGLFDGNFGFGLGIAYGNGRFVAVGGRESGDNNQIGYSLDGQEWTLATETNGLFSADGVGGSIAYAPLPLSLPLSSSKFFFPAGTPIQTDQGLIMIDKINPQNHTINHQAIRELTSIPSATTEEPYLIRFEKHALAYNYPSRATVMAKDHLIEFEGRKVPAYQLLAHTDKVKKVISTEETVYTVRLAEHSKIKVNNLVCESLPTDIA